MKYSDNEFKWVAVLNRKIPIAKLLNALAHLAITIPGRCKSASADVVHDYNDSNGELMSRVSNWPVIILQAKNGNQLRSLRSSANELGIACQAFADSMLADSADAQIVQTRATPETDVEYFAVMMFGEAEELQGLTRKFSLFSTTGLQGETQG